MELSKIPIYLGGYSMKNKLRVLCSVLLLIVVLISCTGCLGYATRLPNNTYDKVSKVLFGVDGTEYILAYKDSMDDFVATIEKTLDSGKIDIAGGLGVFGKVKMPYGDFAVENQKESTRLWFEMLIEGGKYKKLFFTLGASDTQTIWIQATKTDSYDDGGFLEYYACDCKELIELATNYAKSIEGIDGATKIEAIKYDMGEEIGSVTVTGEADVQHIVDNLSSLKLKELKYNEPTAIEYELTFYNDDGEIIKSIAITLDGWIDYGSLHSVVGGELDIEYIEGLFENIYNKEICEHAWDDGVEVEGGNDAYLMEYTCTICGEKDQQIIFIIPPNNDILYVSSYPQDFEYNGKHYHLVQGDGLKTTATQKEVGGLLGYIIREEDISAFTQEYPNVDYVIDNSIYDYYEGNRAAFYSLKAYPDLSVICMRQLGDYVLFQVEGNRDLQFEIRDRAKEENLPCDDAIERFYEDESNEYYFSAIKSQYVVVIYNNGTSEDIVTALNSGRVTISDLDEFGIEYYSETKQ